MRGGGCIICGEGKGALNEVIPVILKYLCICFVPLLVKLFCKADAKVILFCTGENNKDRSRVTRFTPFQGVLALPSGKYHQITQPNYGDPVELFVKRKQKWFAIES